MEIEPGWYRHWKGGYYFVITEALNTETEQIDVVYRDNQLRVFTRPKSQWFDLMGEDGTPRFEKIEGAVTAYHVSAS